MSDDDAGRKLQIAALGILSPIPVHLWGRDHQTTVLYAESRAVDHDGKLPEDDKRMRADATRYPTRLAHDVEIAGHTDYDCLKDAEEAGFLTYVDGIVRFTDAGWEYVHGLRRARTGGV